MTDTSNSNLLAHLNCISLAYKEKRDQWRHKSYSNACEVISNYGKKVNSSKDIAHLRGIGQSTCTDIDEFLTTGSSTRYKELGCKDDIRLAELMTKPGVGPQTALKINRGETVTVTTHQRIAEAYREELSQRIPRSEMREIELHLSELLPQTVKWVMAGSYRREAESSSDVDILVSQATVSMISIRTYLSSLIVEDFTPGAIVKYMGVIKFKGKCHHIDIRLVDGSSWGTALLHFSSGKQFNKELRLYANKLGYSLSEYGLESLTTGQVWKFNTEEEVFAALGVRYFSPKERQ